MTTAKARKPAYEPTVAHAGCAPTATLPALAAQFTGLYLAMSAIQAGTSRSEMNAPDRNVSGKTRVVEAPIRASRCRVSSANQLERPATGPPLRPDTPIRAARPNPPPGNVAPIPQPIATMIADCSTVVRPW